MAEQQNIEVKGDRPLNEFDEDKLRFKEVAQRIAISLVDRVSDDSLVVGVEGTWGSGKSSLLFLIGQELRNLPQDRRPTVIDFRPWLIGNRDALIVSLFGELSNQLDQVASDRGNSTPAKIARAKSAAEALRRFMGGLSATGSMVEVVGEASGIGLIKFLGKGAKTVGDWAKGKQPPPQLSELKDNLIESLTELDHRFIITIDDIDRLEPIEVTEVLRLIRSVADLPNVIYLLCYDTEVLSQSIEKAVGVSDGTEFLEKIIQLTIMVPKPEPLQLRQWFSDELNKIAEVKNEDELSRLRQVIDYEGGRQLRTPRSVVRALDGVRFFWPPLREISADLADLVWLQLIKDGNPKLYRWIEDYCSTASVIALGTANVDDSGKSKKKTELTESVPKNHFDDFAYRQNFADQLPGVEVPYSEDTDGFDIFCDVKYQNRSDAIRTRRLASPDHYRLYFALAGPSHALTHEQVESVWYAAGNSAERAGEELLKLHAETVSSSLTKADILLERARDGLEKTLSQDQCTNLLISFSLIMDEAYFRRPFDINWIDSIWDRAQRLIPSLISSVETEDQTSVVIKMFRDGHAIGWLSSLLRVEIFAHGLHGDRAESEEKWILSDNQIGQVVEVMTCRYREMTVKEILDTPSPISVLYAWLQAGDREGPRKLLSSSIQSDASLIEILEKLTTTITSSNRGTFSILKKGNLDHFLDYDQVVRRVDELRAHSELGERAAQLKIFIRDGLGY
jgi:predicted KAP-like P-loop ATPase